MTDPVARLTAAVAERYAIERALRQERASAFGNALSFAHA